MKIPNQTRTAVAVFVKTPGLSPIKTRLAAEIGAENAEVFYKLSLDCIRATLLNAQGHDHEIVPIWAVAEASGITHENWQNFPQISQGEGDLGSRLAHVYSKLKADFDCVILIGADSPLLSVRAILDARKILIDRISKTQFVIGPSLDGGFYLLGGMENIPEHSWKRVEYSRSNTGEALSAELERIGRIEILPPLGDVDVKSDLQVLFNAGQDLATPSAQQRKLLDWIRNAITTAH